MYIQDHPRECGKNTIDEGEFLDVLGSPPRVREKLHLLCWLESMSGITPASAGKTLKDPIEIANPD